MYQQHKSPTLGCTEFHYIPLQPLLKLQCYRFTNPPPNCFRSIAIPALPRRPANHPSLTALLRKLALGGKTLLTFSRTLTLTGPTCISIGTVASNLIRRDFGSPASCCLAVGGGVGGRVKSCASSSSGSSSGNSSSSLSPSISATFWDVSVFILSRSFLALSVFLDVAARSFARAACS